MKRNAQEPRPHACPTVVFVRSRDGSNERLLCQILGIVTVPRELTKKSKQSRMVPFDQQVEGIGIAFVYSSCEEKIVQINVLSWLSHL